MSEPTPTYPPEPWDLAGVGHLTLWRVPVTALPALPFGARPLAVRGQALVATAFVAYSEAGDMAYDELLAAVVVRRRRGLRPGVGLSITDIWVDSETSMHGGRGLWGIPKDLAEFDGLAARGPAGAIARARFAGRRAPVVRLPTLRSNVVQTLRGRTVASAIRTGGRVRPARATWELDPDGPLAWLRTGRPLTSAVAEEFAMRFGSPAAP